MGFNEFMEKGRTDKAFAAKFQGLTSVDDIVALAKNEGYNISVSDFNEQMSDDELDNVAGGANLNNDWAKGNGSKEKNRAIVAAGPNWVAVNPIAVAVAG